MNETVLLAADAAAPIEAGTKLCPICNARVFSDMDTCYNCMYLFGSKPELEQEATRSETPSVAHDALPQNTSTCVTSERETRSRFLYGHGGAAEHRTAERARKGDDLLEQLLVELHGFLGEFLLDRGIDIKQL